MKAKSSCHQTGLSWNADFADGGYSLLSEYDLLSVPNKNGKLIFKSHISSNINFKIHHLNIIT